MQEGKSDDTAPKANFSRSLEEDATGERQADTDDLYQSLLGVIEVAKAKSRTSETQPPDPYMYVSPNSVVFRESQDPGPLESAYQKLGVYVEGDYRHIMTSGEKWLVESLIGQPIIAIVVDYDDEEVIKGRYVFVGADDGPKELLRLPGRLGRFDCEREILELAMDCILRRTEGDPYTDDPEWLTEELLRKIFLKDINLATTDELLSVRTELAGAMDKHDQQINRYSQALDDSKASQNQGRWSRRR